MNEIDLIPGDYRQQLLMRRWGGRLGWVAGALVLVVLVAKLWLSLAVAAERRRIADLKANETRVLEQRKQLDELTALQQDLSGRVEILKALRGGPPADGMFTLIDRAINADTWVKEIAFDRASPVEEGAPGTETAGYFIIVDRTRPGPGPADDWQGNRMQLKGQVVSHAALSLFVRQLLRQPEVADVRLLNTGTRAYTFGTVIDFELTIHIAGGDAWN